MRPATPNPLTLEEHRQLGRELRVTNARLRQLSELVASVYGPANRAAFSFQKLADAMERTCQDLETQATKDVGGYPGETFYL